MLFHTLKTYMNFELLICWPWPWRNWTLPLLGSGMPPHQVDRLLTKPSPFSPKDLLFQLRYFFSSCAVRWWSSACFGFLPFETLRLEFHLETFPAQDSSAGIWFPSLYSGVPTTQEGPFNIEGPHSPQKKGERGHKTNFLWKIHFLLALWVCHLT